MEGFSSFGDNREIPENFNSESDDLDEILGDWDEWFQIEEGILVFSSILKGIRSQQNLRELLVEPKHIEDDLEEVISCLKLAKINSKGFRLEIG